MKHLMINIAGKVQGVGFRYFVQKQAELLGICGFVKNLSNGSVYIEAEADDVQLDVFVEQCRRGPTRSRVDNITLQEAPLCNYKMFEIR